MAGLAPRRCFGSRMFGAKKGAICDCTRPIPVIIFPQFCSARFRGAANQNQVFHFIKAGLYKCSWASSVPCHSTDAATLTISRSSQMKFPQAKIRFASVLLFVLLAMSFMAAQDLRPGSDGDVRPTGHVQGAAAEKLPAAAQRRCSRPGQRHQLPHWRHGIEGQSGSDLHHLVRQLDKWREGF